jgi:hypothetical protein
MGRRPDFKLRHARINRNRGVFGIAAANSSGAELFILNADTYTPPPPIQHVFSALAVDEELNSLIFDVIFRAFAADGADIYGGEESLEPEAI